MQAEDPDESTRGKERPWAALHTLILPRDFDAQVTMALLVLRALLVLFLRWRASPLCRCCHRTSSNCESF